MRRAVLFSFLITLILKTWAQPHLAVESFATGLLNPVDIANAGDDRMFVVERLGDIRIVDALGNVLPGTFLDISDEIESGYQEQGLLGLAFHPDYASNGFFYVYYTDLSGNTTVSRFSVSAGDPNVADPASEQILFTAEQPFLNHNGGCIKFGPDGYLYIGLGDGGSAGDPGDRAQNPMNKLGKMHRIDVDGGTPYAIPADNPFATATDTLKEIWAIGYRNPWRYSFDRLNGNLWVGDVGQNLHEEVDFEPVGSGGHNYGWRCYEGFSEFNTLACDADTSYVFPVFDYPHNYTTGGFAVTGGFVYRGSEFPGMYGYYICADYESGNWWWVHADGGEPWSFEREDDVHSKVSCFGEDTAGELYCADLSTGVIYHVTDACGDFVINTLATEYICGVQNGSIDLTITSGTSPYSIAWSNGSTTEDITGLLPGTYTVTVTDDAGCERTTSTVVTETPAFVATATADGNVLTASGGVTYQWYENGTLIDGATNATYTATEDGNYYVVVTDANGCSVTSNTIGLIVSGIDTVQWMSSVEIYPDPAKDFIHIALQTTGTAQDIFYTITDITGMIIAQNSWSGAAGASTQMMDTHSWPSGVYFLHLSNGKEMVSANFAIAK